MSTGWNPKAVPAWEFYGCEGCCACLSHCVGCCDMIQKHLLSVLSCALQTQLCQLLTMLCAPLLCVSSSALRTVFCIMNHVVPPCCVCCSVLCSADIVSTLRAAHGADPNNTRMGVDVLAGAAGDMSQLGIYESYKVKKQVLISATEAAEMILRVDDIIRCAPRQRQG